LEPILPGPFDHIDRTLKNLEDMKTLAASGIVLEFDLFGMECSHYPFGGVMPSDAQRIDWIVGLVRAGYRDQIVVSHDVYSKHRLLTYGGHGYRHLILNIMPRMRTHGLTEEDIKAIFVDNPKRLLTVVPPSTAASE
jgi:phosphotriesterase-related protein